MTALPRAARLAAMIVTSWVMAWTPLVAAAQEAPAPQTVVTDQMAAEKLVVDDLVVGRLVVQQPLVIPVSPPAVQRSSRWPWKERTPFEEAKPAFPKKEFIGASLDEMTAGRALLFCQDPRQLLTAADVPPALALLTGDPFSCSMAVINQIGLDYAHRADSRQKQSDWAAAIAVTSTAALVIGDGKMVSHTRDLWAIGSLLPILQDDIRAVTPRAMLYRSASNSIFLVSDKYADLGEASGKFAKARLPNLDTLRDTCNLLEDWSREIKTVKGDLPGELILEDLKPRLELCRSQEKALLQYFSLRQRWLDCSTAQCVIDDRRLAMLAGRNAGQLIRHVAGIDAVMKLDPFTAVRTAAASPFQKVADIIAGTSVKGRDDPLDGKKYELALVSDLAAGDVPDKVGTPREPPGSVMTALAALSGLKESSTKNAKPTRVALVATAMTSGGSGTFSLETVSAYLDENSDLLNTARDLALTVKQADRPIALDLDPRKAVLDPKVLAAAAEAKKKAEAAAAAAAAGETPKPEEPAKEEPKPEEPAVGG